MLSDMLINILRGLQQFVDLTGQHFICSDNTLEVRMNQKKLYIITYQVCY